MAKYAVVKIKGHQYKVAEGQEILVDKLSLPLHGKLGKDKVEPEVLLVVDGDKVNVGKPTVKDAKIKIKIVKEEEKGEKIHVRKYKAKSRYRRHIGFRPKFTRLQIEKITV